MTEEKFTGEFKLSIPAFLQKCTESKDKVQGKSWIIDEISDQLSAVVKAGHIDEVKIYLKEGHSYFTLLIKLVGAPTERYLENLEQAAQLGTMTMIIDMITKSPYRMHLLRKYLNEHGEQHGIKTMKSEATKQLQRKRHVGPMYEGINDASQIIQEADQGREEVPFMLFGHQIYN